MKEFIYFFLLTWELVESIVNNVGVHNILSQIIAIFFSVKLQKMNFLICNSVLKNGVRFLLVCLECFKVEEWGPNEGLHGPITGFQVTVNLQMENILQRNSVLIKDPVQLE